MHGKKAIVVYLKIEKAIPEKIRVGAGIILLLLTPFVPFLPGTIGSGLLLRSILYKGDEIIKNAIKSNNLTNDVVHNLDVIVEEAKRLNVDKLEILIPEKYRLYIEGTAKYYNKIKDSKSIEEFLLSLDI